MLLYRNRHTSIDKHSCGYIHKLGIWGLLVVLQDYDSIARLKNYPLVLSVSSKYPVETVKSHVDYRFGSRVGKLQPMCEVWLAPVYISKVLLEPRHTHSLIYSYGCFHIETKELITWPWRLYGLQSHFLSGPWQKSLPTFVLLILFMAAWYFRVSV